jgi:hypothetical protein
MPANLSNVEIEEYKALKAEQRAIQNGIELLYRGGLAGAILIWGFVFTEEQNSSWSFLIGMSPAVFSPFLYLMTRNMAYSGYRIALYVSRAYENDFKSSFGWERYLNGFRNEVDSKKELKVKYDDRLMLSKTYDIIYFSILFVSIIVSIVTILPLSKDFTIDGFHIVKIIIALTIGGFSLFLLVTVKRFTINRSLMLGGV